MAQKIGIHREFKLLTNNINLRLTIYTVHGILVETKNL